MEFTDVVESRRSVRRYADEELDRETVEAIIADATLAPSSYNLQPWEFLVVSEKGNRERLEEVAYGQTHVGEAPVVLAVFGNLDPAAHVDRVLADGVEKGYRDVEEAETTRTRILRMRERSESERAVWTAKSTSLASMALFLAAWSRGVATCPIGGFDPEALRDSFDVPDGYEPVMLVTMGYPESDGSHERLPRRFRRPVSEVVHHERFEPAVRSD